MPSHAARATAGEEPGEFLAVLARPDQEQAGIPADGRKPEPGLDQHVQALAPDIDTPVADRDERILRQAQLGAGLTLRACAPLLPIDGIGNVADTQSQSAVSRCQPAALLRGRDNEPAAPAQRPGPHPAFQRRQCHVAGLERGEDRQPHRHG